MDKKKIKKFSEMQWDLDYLKEMYGWYVLGDFHQMLFLQNLYMWRRYRSKLNLSEKPPRLDPQGNRLGIMMVGTNPSVRSKLKNVWDDPYGKYFGEMIEEAGLNKPMLWMTNIYKWPTPQNRPLSLDEVDEGMVELKLEIDHVNPTIIVALGAQASSIFGVELYKSKMWGKYRVIGMPHPSFVHRNGHGQIRDRFISYLKKLKKYERES